MILYGRRNIWIKIDFYSQQNLIQKYCIFLVLMLHFWSVYFHRSVMLLKLSFLHSSFLVWSSFVFPSITDPVTLLPLQTPIVLLKLFIFQSLVTLQSMTYFWISYNPRHIIQSTPFFSQHLISLSEFILPLSFSSDT